MESPLVSIVTITRNRGNLLRRCISSVLSQTYVNIEHVVVDGASNDNTDEVVAEFHDDRLKYYKLDYNWPLHETAEFAYSKCQGKYISFLDSDDEYLPCKIEKQVKLIESLSDDYGFVYCWMTYYDTANNNQPYFTHNPQLRGFVRDEIIGEPIITGTPTLLFKYDFFKQLGGWRSREEIGIGSDWELCARACQLKSVDFVSESLVKVYVNHGSVRQSESKSYYDDACQRIIIFHQYFLSEFSNNFKRRPDLKVYHYQSIAYNYFRMKQFKLSLKFLFLAFKSNPKELIKNLFKKV